MQRYHVAVYLGVLMLGATIAGPMASGGEVTLVPGETKLTANDASAFQKYGWSIAATGDSMVVGAIGARAVYVHELDDQGAWTQTKLQVSNGQNGAYAYAVAADGDRVLVGAPGAYSSAGAAYLYERDGAGGWTETRFTASDGAADDRFGHNVGISGDTLVIGAIFDDDRGTDSGSTYIYQPDGVGGWQETKLTASDGAADDRYGVSVTVDGDTVVVGSYFDDDRGTDSGSVYLYGPDGLGGWTETKLMASDATGGERFGIDVALSDGRLLVGASQYGLAASGAAYLYERDGSGGWVETKLTPSDGAAGDLYGDSVAIDGNTLLVGAPWDDDKGFSTGSAYVYRADPLGGWPETKLTASDGSAGDWFGGSAAMSGDHLLVGARHDDANGSNSGSAYLYDADCWTNPVVVVAGSDPLCTVLYSGS